MKILETANKVSSHYNELLNRPISKALMLSVALHLPIIYSDRIGEIWREKENIAYVTLEKIKATFKSRPLEKQKHETELHEAMEEGRHIDLGEFVLRSEFTAGRIEGNRMQEALSKLAEIEAKVRNEADGNDQLDTLRHIEAAQGEYSSGHSYLSTILLDRKGNCHARTRFTAALIDRVYPDMEIMYQRVRSGGMMHIRTLAKVEGFWYSMEDLEKPMTEADMRGTVLYKKNDSIKYYINGEKVGEYKKPIVSIKSKTIIISTDDYERIPLPDGISSDNIRDIIFTKPNETGIPMDSAGEAMVGTPIDANGTGNGGTIPFLRVLGGGWRNPLEVEIISSEVADRREEISSKWKQYLTIDSPPEVLPADSGLIQIQNIARGPSSDLREVFSDYLFHFMNHNKDTIPKESSLINHPLIQNNWFFTSYSQCYDGTDDYVPIYNKLMSKICRSRKLQESLYEWASPNLKKAFQTLDMETRKKHLATLNHLREYLRTFNHEKEKQYLEQVKKDESAFVRFSPDTYPGREKYEQIRDQEWGADFSKLDPQTRLARANRYAEAFVFRRINQGMTLEDARHWVEQGIADMEELMDEPQVTFGE